MSRISDLFNQRSEPVLNIYCTAGYPGLNNTVEVMHALEEAGADMIELGMPYSDPLTDGPVIQASNSASLENGMTITKMFEQLKDFRNTISLPVLLMGYMNPVMQFGFEKFCAEAIEKGIDGLILPDLPIYEFENDYGATIKKYGLDFVFLVTPETSDERIRKLDELSSGFLYAVSSSSTTGKEKNFDAVEKYLKRLKSMKLKNPVIAGFGIKDRQTFQAACKYASGAIIGTAYIKALEKTKDIAKATHDFLSTILNTNNKE
jgi:tryptophan synthase alpha chain